MHLLIFIFLLFSLLRHLRVAVGKTAPFTPSLSLSTVSVAVGQYSGWVVFFNPEVFEKICVTVASSDWLPCSDQVGDFAAVGIEMFFTAFEKINLCFGFSLKSFRTACSLGMRSFVWISTISIYILNIRQLLENVRRCSPQWQHLISVLLHLSLLGPWQLHLANVANVSRHFFTVCPYLRHVLQLIDLS